MSSDSHGENGSSRTPATSPAQAKSPVATKVRRVLFGAPRDLRDRSIFHQISLIPVLAWIGLGSDGLSSSSYGPDEAFRTLFGPEGNHAYLAIALALLTTLTVFIISAAYSRIIEEFPQGGGGYLVATKLLGDRVGVVSGCALLIDYMLTIAVSIAAAGDAIFSFLPPHLASIKLPLEIAAILGLITLNIRGVKESVITLAPIFILFAVTHLILILGGIFAHVPEIPETTRVVTHGFHQGMSTLGVGGMLLLLVHAYSMGGGTYTGIEAVSNGLPVMREPRVKTAKRTMIYMSCSLAFTAGGLLLCYVLWHVQPEAGKTMNAVLLERVTASLPLGHAWVVITLFAEGALLVVAAQTGFIDGPRVLANMAVDSWVPRRFASLSERLTTQNGIVLMGACSLAVLMYTHGDVRALVVMYSINVFLTFSLSMFGMTRLWAWQRAGKPGWKRKSALFIVGLALCLTILVITVMQKFREGGWLTIVATGGAVVLCFIIRRHYRAVSQQLRLLYSQLEKVPRVAGQPVGEPNPEQPTAVLLVGGFSGVGMHSLLNIFRGWPGYFKNVVFISVGVIDSGGFKGEKALEDLKASTENALARYVEMARGLGVPSTYRYALGIDPVDEAETLCRHVASEFAHCTFFAGKLIFRREAWYQRILHNETAVAIQKRLHWSGFTTVILPARVE